MAEAGGVLSLMLPGGLAQHGDSVGCSQQSRVTVPPTPQGIASQAGSPETQPWSPVDGRLAICEGLALHAAAPRGKAYELAPVVHLSATKPGLGGGRR